MAVGRDRKQVITFAQPKYARLLPSIQQFNWMHIIGTKSFQVLAGVHCNTGGNITCQNLYYFKNISGHAHVIKVQFETPFTSAAIQIQ